MPAVSAVLADRPYTVVLTGGIAAGKTLVSDEFAQLGIGVIDTDIIARQIVTPGQAALEEIKSTFGADIIDAAGQLKRQVLRARIFSDPNARKKLEAILHPRIRREVSKAITRVKSVYCILVIPLWVENGTYPHIDRVLVVDVNPATQLDRLMSRDGSSRVEAHQALASQASRAERLGIADDVLENSGSPIATRQHVAQLHQKYLHLAADSANSADHDNV